MLDNRQSFNYVCVSRPARDASECFCQLIIGRKAIYKKDFGNTEEGGKVATKGHPPYIHVGKRELNEGGG